MTEKVWLVNMHNIGKYEKSYYIETFSEVKSFVSFDPFT